MKPIHKIYLLWVLLALSIAPAFSVIGKTFSGTIFDADTHKPIEGAVLYFPDLKLGTNTGLDGRFTFNNLPQSNTVIHISCVGYRTIIQNINLQEIISLDFRMEHAATELNEVVVTGLTKASEQKRNPTPISVVSQRELLEKASSNIIDAISAQPGVSQVSTGASISKPVIRGLGYNRVVVVNDGVRQEGQQWGDEHGVEIDENDVGKVEILKGPASLVYGSDAMAGVVNMIALPAVTDGKISGTLSSNFQTNNGLYANSVNSMGNRKGLIWEVRLSDKRAHAYQNKYDGYVFNSGFAERAASGTLGLSKTWGFSTLKVSYYHLLPGLVEGERDSASGQFIKPIVNSSGNADNAIVSDSDNKSYSVSTPYQKIEHYKAVLNNNFYLGGGNLLATIGFQQNRRQEFANVLTPNDYQLFFLLNTFTYDLRYNLREKNKLNISFGANGMQQSSRNKGVEFLVPEYNLFDFGVFSILKKNLGVVDVSGGVRFDGRSQQSKELYLDADNSITTPFNLGAVQRFVAFNNLYSGFSGSVGLTWQVSKQLYTKLNLSRGFRAPNISELGANGVHEGTIRYELGNVDLKPETSLQFDYTFGVNSEHISAELNLFDNRISDFIFLRKLNNNAGGDSIRDQFPVFKYTSGNAHLRGGELRVDIHPHPLDWLHIENSFSYVEAYQQNQPDSMHYLPLTPAPKWQLTLRAEVDKCGGFLRNGFARFGFDRYFAQEKIYSAFGTETRTPAYALVSLGFGADVVHKRRTLFSLFVNADNLMDVAYQSHLSRLKYAPTNNATGRSGVYNMGRNVSVKLVVPLSMH